MSRAFVKEDEGARWVAPQAPRAYRLIWKGDSQSSQSQGDLHDHQAQGEVLQETDDLLSALQWLQDRERPGFELRDAQGTLLAVNHLA